MNTVMRNQQIALTASENPRTPTRPPNRPIRSTGGISVRPQAGSAYTPYSDSSHDWEKVRAPGGRRLFCRLVVAFTFIAALGFSFILLGALFVRQAYDIYQTHKLSLPLVWCIIGIVTGTLMFLGSFILGRLIISSKWRRNEQRDYSRPGNCGAVRYRPGNQSRDVSSSDPDLPPPYELSQPPSIFIITGGNVSIPGRTSEFVQLPSYNELPLQEPPKYTLYETAASDEHTDNAGQNDNVIPLPPGAAAVETYENTCSSDSVVDITAESTCRSASASPTEGATSQSNCSTVESAQNVDDNASSTLPNIATS